MLLRTMSRALLLATVLSSFPHTALAQEAAANDTETRARENKEAEGGQKMTELPVITILATRQEADPLATPRSVSVIDSAAMQKHFVTDMQDLIRYEPGITVARTTSGTDPFATFSGFNIRGVGGNRVQILVDGSRTPERIVDGTRDYLDFNFTKQADIVRGPGSALWGADALGGIVALQTIDPEDILGPDRVSGGEFSTSYDSLDNAFNNALTYAHRLTPELSVLGGIAYTRADEPEFGNARADGGIYGCPRNIADGATPCNALDPMGKSSYRALAKAVYTPSADHRFELTADYLRRNTDVDVDSILGPVYSSTTSLPTGEVNTGVDRHLDLYRGRFGIEHDWDVGGAFVDQVRWSLSHSPSGYKRTGTRRSISAVGDSLVTNDSLEYSESFTELDIQLTSRFGTGSLDHVVTWGFDGDYTLTDYQNISSVNNLTTGTTTETRAGGFNFANATTVRADFYAQDEISAFDGRLRVTPGVRLANYGLDPRPDSDYKPVPGKEPVKVSKSTLLFDIGATYDLTDNLSLYGGFNQGFKMPTAQQLYTSLPGTFFDLVPAPDLKPERVDNYEIGLRGRFDRGFFSVGAFHAGYTDFIENFYNPPGTSDYTYRNLSSVTVYGLEASGAYDITDTLRTDFSLAWQKGKQKAGPGEPTTPHTVPPLTAVVGLTYLVPDYNLKLEAVGTFVADVKETASVNDYKPDGYALLDLFAGWKPSENSELRLGIKNVFDQRYFVANAATYGLTASPSVARTNPIELQTGAARTYMASFNVKF
ncbi:MAG: TonB-dependent hemoglobin/transferrin/lactoferrin family receptor [Mesorhizobium sp.]